jgi:AcrR family transcriptional regulator
MGTPGRKKNPEQTTATRNKFLETSFNLFVSKNIESVTMSQIAKASGYRDMTLYRYFPSKPILVVAVASWKWEQFQRAMLELRLKKGKENLSAKEIFDFYIESFLLLYKNHKDLLRFNQFFNVYVKSENIETEIMRPYDAMIGNLRERFHNMYLKAKEDKTLKTTETEEEMFSTTLHLMLAVVTRYAVGLVYIPDNGFNAEKELYKMKEMLLARYVE